MVYNQKRLNDTTYKDKYTLPGIGYLLLKIRHKKAYNKFDLKSGFYQISMHYESTEWKAFICPQGHFEWLVMPFGLKMHQQSFKEKWIAFFKNIMISFLSILMALQYSQMISHIMSNIF